MDAHAGLYAADPACNSGHAHGAHHVGCREEMQPAGSVVQLRALGLHNHPGVVGIEDVATILALPGGPAPLEELFGMRDVRPHPQLCVVDGVRGAFPSLSAADGHAGRDHEAPYLQSLHGSKLV